MTQSEFQLTQNQVSGAQCIRLLSYLQTHYEIDPLTSWTELGIYRLGARIWDLKKAGIGIIAARKKVYNQHGERFVVASYKLSTDVDKCSN
jgi:hypothetical protein